MQVAIKAVNHKKYGMLRKINGISEADAMQKCQNSSNVVKMVEEIRQTDKTYLITKFVQSGDLVAYMESREDN